MTVTAHPAQGTDSEPTLILAPMRGLTDVAFRNAFAEGQEAVAQGRSKQTCTGSGSN